jgi:hypothetical protein
VQRAQQFAQVEGVVSICSLPASILDRSRMSEMMPVSDCALSLIWSRYWRRRSSSMSGARARSARPIMPFSGVRSSWLVLARKALLARLAASASSRARASACFDLAALGDVLDDPDRAAAWPGGGVDGLAEDAARKVLPSRRAFAVRPRPARRAPARARSLRRRS